MEKRRKEEMKWKGKERKKNKRKRERKQEIKQKWGKKKKKKKKKKGNFEKGKNRKVDQKIINQNKGRDKIMNKDGNKWQQRKGDIT